MTIAIGLLLFAFTITIHEFSHGATAYLLGDSTAHRAGRLSMNPFKHIDPFWTVIVPIALYFLHLPVFGMAKPVPVNFGALRKPKRDMVFVAAAGPLSNFILACILISFHNMYPYPILEFAIILNLLLCFFNLIPIPPLDGGRILVGLLPNSLAIWVAKLERYGLLIIIALIYFGFVDQFLRVTLNIIGKMI